MDQESSESVVFDQCVRSLEGNRGGAYSNIDESDDLRDREKLEVFVLCTAYLD